MRKLYDFPPSGNCHKIRMMLSILGLEYERVHMDLLAKEQMAPEFLALNPMHKVPVLVDGDLVLRDSSAILVYLARRYAGTRWYPDDADGMGEVQQWLSLAVNEIFHGLGISRALVIFNRQGDHAGAAALANATLAILEQRLEKHDWLALDRPTIADIACYPYTALVEEGNVPLAPYPAVRKWLARVEALPGYVAMKGMPYMQDA
ncbi:MAG: glutathione S-transferase family protein [Pseudomonadota bacterium]|nr:glutathione S-transferase family protein [Pseudomonadota bacterium]